MVIREMNWKECLRVLVGTSLARLACAQENQPYVVPVYLAYDEESGCLYGFTTPGQKIEWMRGNPLVCVEVDEVAAYDQWVSVIVTGRYEELVETTRNDAERLWAPGRPRLVGEAAPPWSVESQHRHCDEEGYDDEDCDAERQRAWQVLESHPMWSEPGFSAWSARAHRDSAKPFSSVFYRIRIDHVTGHEATPDARHLSAPAVPPSPDGRWGWLGRALSRLFGSKSMRWHR
jgi:nitroimidazol reductase NimA-like FMN-containing flavoprotein (pyridoxamine 5'-phosphate oxidase superfamily)